MNGSIGGAQSRKGKAAVDEMPFDSSKYDRFSRFVKIKCVKSGGVRNSDIVEEIGARKMVDAVRTSKACCIINGNRCGRNKQVHIIGASAEIEIASGGGDLVEMAVDHSVHVRIA